MSVLPRRWLLNAIIVLSFLVPLISFSQVTIKEKVEIKPKARLASSPATELRVVFYWLANKTPGGTDDPIHLGILEPNGESRGFDLRSGTKRGDYSEAITSVGENGYGGEDVYTNRDARPGLYFFYAIADTSTGIIPMFGPYWVDVYIGGQLDRTIIFERFGWGLVPDTRYRVNALMYTLLGEPGGPCAGAHFEFDEIQDVQHGETRTLHAPILDDCGNNVDPPPEYYYKYELLGDTLSWGFLRDVNTGRTGTVIDSVSTTIIEYIAFGKEPESPKEITLRVSAENGSITPATTTFALLPPEVSVLAGKTTLSFGDTTLLTMQVRSPGGPWMSKPDDWKASFGIAQQDTFGSLYMLDSTDYNPDVTEYEPAVVYYAHPQVAADSDNVIILLMANEPGSGDSKIETPISRGEGMLGKKSAPAPTVMTKSSSLKRPRGALASNRINFSTHYGLVRLKLRKSVILLGETKYYFVKNDNGSLSIEETTNPNTNPGINDASVWQANPVTPVLDRPTSGKRLGVYWETQKPISNGTNLAPGMIRLVGRFWHADSIYSVDLAATYDGNLLHKKIEVKKPDVLGDKNLSPEARHSMVKDVFKNDLNLDELVIKYAGANGIPPQMIKGQMEKECMNPHTKVFEPVWRYEPIVDLKFQEDEDLTKRFFPDASPFAKLIDHPKGTGDWPYDAQLPHSNVYPTAYDNSAVTIGSYIADNWDKYKKRGSLGEPDSILSSSDLAQRFKELYKPPTKLNRISDSQAKQSTYAALGKELNDAETRLAQRYDQIAQTRIVTSYGFAQLMYSMTIDVDGKYYKETDGRYFPTDTPYMEKLNSHRYPEMLSEQNTFMPIYCDRLLRNLNWLFPDRIPPSQWSTTKLGARKGYEANWKASLRYYNPDPKYAPDVMLRSIKYSPH